MENACYNTRAHSPRTARYNECSLMHHSYVFLLLISIGGGYRNTSLSKAIRFNSTTSCSLKSGINTFNKDEGDERLKQREQRRGEGGQYKKKSHGGKCRYTL